jgi:hypothetical protein
MFLVKKNCLFFQLNSQKKCGNTWKLLNEHKKRCWLEVVGILFSWKRVRFLVLKKMFIFSLLGFSPSPFLNNSYIKVRLIGPKSNILKNIFFM